MGRRGYPPEFRRKVLDRGAPDDSGVDDRLTLPAEQRGLADTGLGSHGGHRLTRSQPGDDLPADRSVDEY